jgi:hypothetical protein
MTDSPDQNLAREVRDDNREVRADGREGRADVREGGASRRDDRADEREDRAVGREKRAVVRETSAAGRDDTLHKLVRVLIVLTIVLCVLSLASTVRSFVVQAAVNEIENIETDQTRTADETNQVARDTLAELRLAVPEEGDTTTADAVAAIHRMEGFLCGGPCPPP